MPRLPSKVAFCNFIVKLHKSADKSRLKPNTFVFKVDPRMTKTEVKEYFRKVYQLEPTKVGTVNYDGRLTRSLRGKPFKEDRFKKAYVEFKPPEGVDELRIPGWEH